MAYHMNGYLTVEATKERKKYLLTYKLDENNYNSLVNVFPLKQNA